MKNTKTYRTGVLVKISFFALFLTSIFSGCSNLMDGKLKDESKNKKKILTDIVISSVKLGKEVCEKNKEVGIESETAVLVVEFAESYAGLNVTVNGEAASVKDKRAEFNLKDITEAGIAVKIVANGTDKNEEVFSFTAKKILPVKPKLLSLQIKHAVSDAVLFTGENFTSNEIDAGTFDDLERVKIIARAEEGAVITFSPVLENKNEFPLKLIGENQLNIILSRKGLSNAYIVKITRKASAAVDRKVKAIKVDFGWMAAYDSASAIFAEKDTVQQNRFNLVLQHIKAGQKCFVFIEGEDKEDIVILAGKEGKFTANNTGIDIGATPAVGGTQVFDFYLFQKDADTANLGLGTKFSLKITVSAEPNTKITSVKFNNIAGKIDGQAITCETEFEVGTVITADVMCEASTSVAVINDNKEVKIDSSGASFKIIVTPAEGETWKKTYNVTLKAKTEAVKRVTGIKYLVGGVPSNIYDLSETAARNTENICNVSYESGPFAFVPVVSEGDIKEVQLKEWNGYKKMEIYNNFCYFIQRPYALNNSGLTIKVIFTDGKTDEFLIKKEF